MANMKLIALLMVCLFVGAFAYTPSLTAPKLRNLRAAERVSLVERSADSGSSEAKKRSVESGNNGCHLNGIDEIALAISEAVTEILSVIRKMLTLTNLDEVPGQISEILNIIMRLLNKLSVGNIIDVLRDNLDTLKQIPGLGTVISVAETVIQGPLSLISSVWSIVKSFLRTANSLLPIPLPSLCPAGQ